MPEKGKGYAMWYAIQVLTGQESLTITLIHALIGENYYEDLFIPEKELLLQKQGEWKKVKSLMFPGYIFAVTDHAEELFLQLKTVPKLTKLLSVGEEIVPISRWEELLLQELTNQNHLAEFSSGFFEGDYLIIEKGPLSGKEALVRKIDRHKRTAMLEVEMFGQKIQIKMGLEVVRKAG